MTVETEIGRRPKRSPRGRRVCLLTGAGGIFGASFCRRCSGRYRIAAVYRNSPPAVASQHQRLIDPLAPGVPLPENANPVFAIQSDLREPGEIDRVIELVLARYDRIDLLVNAAAVFIKSPLVDSHILDGALDEQFAINAMLPLRMAAAVAQTFWRTRDLENRRRRRHVVNISSTSGIYVFPGGGQSAYGASKAALNFLTRHMAHEFAPFGVRVNAVAPTSFPRLVPTWRVVDSVARLDRGEANGQIVVVDRHGERAIERG